jgi:hypothetical protein
MNGLSFPMPQAFSGGVDFSPLANLGNVYQQTQDRNRRLTALAQLGADPNQNALALIQSGDPQLAAQGLTLQRQTAGDIEAKREWEAQQRIREQTAAQQKEKFEEDTPRFRYRQVQEGIKEGRLPADIMKNPAWQAYVQTGEKIPDAAAANRAGLSPVWGTRKDPVTGQDVPVMLQTTGTGEAVETKLPPGVAVTNEPMKIEGPTGTTLMDKYTHQVIGFIPKDVAGAAAQKAVGEAKGEAVASLPKVEADAKLMTDTIDKLLAPHPGKKFSLGAASALPTVPGTPQADYRAILDQLESQRFLEAYGSLRGGGAISNYEDRRASDAKARLHRAQTPEAFDEALREYKEIIQSGVERARKMAGQQAAQAPAKADPLGLR